MRLRSSVTNRLQGKNKLKNVETKVIYQSILKWNWKAIEKADNEHFNGIKEIYEQPKSICRLVYADA